MENKTLTPNLNTMRTQEEISTKVEELQKELDDNIGDSNILKMQIDILLEDDDADNYLNHEDSWIHQGAETARCWMDGAEWE